MVDGELNFITKVDKTGFEKGKKAIGNGLDSLKSSLKSFAKVAAAAFSVKMIYDFAKASKEAYNTQIEQETKLTTIMKQRMNATDEQIDSVKQLAAEQQKLGVIGDEVQLAGAQQVATFLNETESINTLLPAMNNLLAQQNGLNATTSDAVNIGNMMGKVLQGQTSALKRVGISFSDAEEQVLKYGTESERAAMLAQVITNNVGEMNQALAQTDAGKQKQLANTMGDVTEQFGQAVMQIETAFLPLLSRLASGFSTVASAALSFSSAIKSAFGIESETNSAAVATTTASAAASAADSYEDIAESAEETKKAQENTLASFDKVIKIGKQENGGTSSGGGGGGTSPSVTASPAKVVKASSWADELKAALKKGDWGGLGKMLADKINGIVSKIKWKEVGKKLGQGITNAFTFAYNFLKNTKWTDIGSGFANFLNGLMEKTNFNTIGRTLGARLNAMIGLAFGFVTTFDFAAAGLGFADLINGWVDEFDAAQLARTISKAAKGILDFISTTLKKTDWKKIGTKISEFINNIDWKGVLKSLVEVIKGIIKAAPELLSGIIRTLDFENAAGLFALLFAPKMASKLLDFFKQDSSTKTTLTDAGKAVGTKVGDGVTGQGSSIASGLVGKISSGLQAAGTIASAFGIGYAIGTLIRQGLDAVDLLKPLESAIEKYLDDSLWGDFILWATGDSKKNSRSQAKVDFAIDELKEKIKKFEQMGYKIDYNVTGSDLNKQLEYLVQQANKSNTLSSSSNYVASTSERIQEAKITAEIEKIKKSWKGPMPEPAVLRKIARANLGLPALATGTVVPANYGRFAAILGDNKKEPEVVSPLSTMKQAVLEALAMQAQQKQPAVINISLDTRNGRRLLTKEVIDDINDIIDSTGKVPINI